MANPEYRRRIIVRNRRQDHRSRSKNPGRAGRVESRHPALRPRIGQPTCLFSCTAGAILAWALDLRVRMDRVPAVDRPGILAGGNLRLMTVDGRPPMAQRPLSRVAGDKNRTAEDKTGQVPAVTPSDDNQMPSSSSPPDDYNNLMAASTRSKKKKPSSPSHEQIQDHVQDSAASIPPPSEPASASSTAVSAPDTASRRPPTDPAYRSRYAAGGSQPRGQKKPGRRESVFIENLDGAVTASASININTTVPPPPSSPSPLPHHSYRTHSINPLGSKESYIMQLPILPSRFSILLFLLVACSTISLSTSAEHDLDGLLKRVPGAEGVVERREASTAPSFRIGPAIQNPQKDIPKLRTGLLVLGIGCLFAGLMT
ncbi:hypothetical protein Dda_5632 [Drechslerella dactyloides]|uniref:Uncharacterized protein n=1 Tax=Drechslerella dactyloides TaxID=74499 RepID=A0AAD6NKE6_DREDA|nr:hypothetical protein Dda_5632 [Drechslerella dactyloides]